MFILLTTASGLPILISHTGMTIEPEVATGRSTVILPHANREKPKIIVQEGFTEILAGLRERGFLPTAPEPAKPVVPEFQEPKVEVVMAEVEPPQSVFNSEAIMDAMAATAVESKSQSRRRAAKK